jgi:hypothetical protein
VRNNYLVKFLPVFIFMLSALSIALIITYGKVDAFQQWVYLGSFSCFFYLMILLVMYFAVRRSQERYESSTYMVAFRLGILPWAAWSLFIIIRAYISFPHPTNFGQMTAFGLLCLVASLVSTWLQIAERTLNLHKRRLSNLRIEKLQGDD